MWLIVGSEAYNLDQFHRIFVVDSPRTTDGTRIFIEMRAGGAQEADARRVLQFESVDERDNALQMIYGALEANLPSFNLHQQFQEIEEELAGEAMTPMLQEAWKVISNAYDGDWNNAPDMWRARAETFRERFFGTGGDDA